MHGPSPFLPGQLRFRCFFGLTGSDDILCPRPDHLQKTLSIFFKLELSHTGNFQHSILICRFFDTHLHQCLVGKIQYTAEPFSSLAISARRPRRISKDSSCSLLRTSPAVFSLFSSAFPSPLSPVLCHLHCKCLLPCNQCFRLFSRFTII